MTQITSLIPNTRLFHRSVAAHVLAIGLGVAVAAATVVDRSIVSAQSKGPEPMITLTTKPSPPVTGDNVFEVTVQGSDGRPVVDADVSVLLVMPAMPKMGMPEMRNTIVLKPVEGKSSGEGRYTGRGQVWMAGRWNVTVMVKVGGKDVAEKTLTLVAK
jgi:hypothetical protein